MDSIQSLDISMKYVNSEGRVIDLSQAPYIGERSSELLSYKWNYVTQGQAVQRIVKFEKELIEKPFHVLISGADKEEYYGNLERFLQYTDVDINNLQMGRLYIGEYYLEGYIIANNKPKKYLDTNKTLIECTLICERGNWQKDVLFSYRTTGWQHGGYEGEQQYTGTGITYPYGYPYDYSAPFGKGYMVNESYMDTDFELTFYGAIQYPKITIGGAVYEFIDCPISADEKIVVNSQKKKAVLVRHNGEEENIFMKRNKEHKIYQKIKGKGNMVIMDSPMNVDIRLFIERSEPKWSTRLWT